MLSHYFEIYSYFSGMFVVAILRAALSHRYNFRYISLKIENFVFSIDSILLYLYSVFKVQVVLKV